MSEGSGETERCEAIVTALRVYAPRHGRAAEDDEDPGPSEPPPSPPALPRRRYPFEALVFDTETLVEPAQRLLAAWVVLRAASCLAAWAPGPQEPIAALGCVAA